MQLIAKGEIGPAMAEFNNAIGMNASYAPAYFGRGIAFLRLDDPARAISELSTAIRLDPNSALAYVARGRAYEMKGQREAAESDFAQATARGLKRGNDF